MKTVINNFFDESDIGLISSLKLHKKIDDKGVLFIIIKFQNLEKLNQNYLMSKL